MKFELRLPNVKWGGFILILSLSQMM